jgi:hypothetical protein
MALSFAWQQYDDALDRLRLFSPDLGDRDGFLAACADVARCANEVAAATADRPEIAALFDELGEIFSLFSSGHFDADQIRSFARHGVEHAAAVGNTPLASEAAELQIALAEPD